MYSRNAHILWRIYIPIVTLFVQQEKLELAGNPQDLVEVGGGQFCGIVAPHGDAVPPQGPGHELRQRVNRDVTPVSVKTKFNLITNKLI